MKAKKILTSFILASLATFVLPTSTHYIGSRSFASTELPATLHIQSTKIDGSTGVYRVGPNNHDGKVIATVTVDCAGQDGSKSPHATYEGVDPAPPHLKNSYVILLVKKDSILQSSQAEAYDHYCDAAGAPLRKDQSQIRMDLIRQTFLKNDSMING
ncbi:MAG TPA: hypothetical protein DCY07_08310 [Rhodospirillaceae bacterium]|nr:hypothetical protein [Rhodospirillaceae bacterium]